MAMNWSGNVQLNKLSFQPTSPSALEGVIRRLVASGESVRALAGKYSTSHVLAPNMGGKTINVTKLLLDARQQEASPPKVAPFASRGPASWYRSSTAGLVQISAGATIDEVNRYLTSQNRSLPMMGAFSGQTFVGAMLTGTHGTGAKIGPLADMAVSLDVVTVDGGQVVRYRIERSNGPTDASAYERDTGRRVFHDDDLFCAFVISFGYLGVITSVVVKTVPLFRLRHVGSILSWSEVKERFADFMGGGVPRRVAGAYGVSVTMNPYRDSRGNWPTCIWNEIQVTTENITQRARPSPFVPASAMAPGLLNLTSDSQIPSQVDVVLQSTVEPPRVDIAHAILATPTPFALKGYGLEFGFSVRPDQSYVRAIEHLLLKIAQLETQPSPQRLGGFFTIRFVRQSSAYLAQSYETIPGDNVTCTLEVLAASQIGRADAILPALAEVALEQRGRTHWGQLFDVRPNLRTLSRSSIQEACAAHPGYPRWKPHLSRFNATGTFSNAVGACFP